MEAWELRQRQSLPLVAKIILTKQRIREWYEAWDGQVYVSFSGGKDSTVLLHLVRELYPDVPAVFVDTGLEYPEIKEFVKTVDNVTWLRPSMPFHKVIEKYGFPVISKRQAEYIGRVQRKPNDMATINKCLYGIQKNGKQSQFRISNKWHYLVNAPFKVSEACCRVMKESCFLKLERKGYKPLIGSMADEGADRQQKYLQTGCNAFDKKRPMSKPLGFWREQDVLQCLKEFKIPYSSVYGDIIEDSDGKLRTTGATRTGCMFCMFGVHLEKGENRFQRMARTHPKHYDYCINKLGCGQVLDYIGVDYRPI
jgi:3'-phosphoadenosine 5'-phosphosulfate sulfotransferase (PAPS reductase)/FAD synthetase